MEIWIPIALVAYLINAFVFVIDKYLLHSPIPRPFVYAFWVSVLSGFVLVLIPFGVSFPGPEYLLITLSAGFVNFLGLIFLYRSVQASDVSVASTKVGTFSIVSSFLFSMLLLGSHFPLSTLVSLGFFAAGLFLLARTNKKVLLDTIISGIFIGLSIVLLKWSFESAGLINGIFWTRIGFALAALFSLISPEARTEIKDVLKSSSRGSKLIFIVNKGLATFGFLVLYYAIKLGDVSIINALSGFQFIFVLMIALALKGHLNIEERTEKQFLASKIGGISLIIIGFLLLL